MSILPTLLFLTTGIVKELAPQDASSVPPPVGAALQTLKCLCSHSYSRDITVKDQWMASLRSALATMLHYAKTGKIIVVYRTGNNCL